MSSQRREAFRKIQANLNIMATQGDKSAADKLVIYELILDVRTRWSSTYFMLARALQLRRVCLSYFPTLIREILNLIYRLLIFSPAIRCILVYSSSIFRQPDGRKLSV